MATSSKGDVHLVTESFPACHLSPSLTDVEATGDSCNSCRVVLGSQLSPASTPSLLSTLLSSHCIWSHDSSSSQSQWLIYTDTMIKTWLLILAGIILMRIHSPPLTSPTTPTPACFLDILMTELSLTNPCSSACVPNSPLPTHPFRFSLEALFSKEPCKSPRSTSKRESALSFSLCSAPSVPQTTVSQLVYIWLLPHWAVTWKERTHFCLFSLASYRMPGTKQTVWRCLLNEWTIIITSHIPSIQTLRLSSEHGVPSLTLFDKEKKKSNPSAIQ